MFHTINKSPFERNSLDTCLRLSKKGSAILLFEDGVYAALKGTQVSAKVEGAVGEHPIFVLGPDLKARGLSEDHVIEGVSVVDYGGFVDLAAEHGAVNAWL
ncbi:sulfurtransferase complex subunit TusB [Varunaivibrio sulfuroxidans]|uniref:tRNA 2-thiouridine synthesizing protein B n=1 Tax=Varunaivibrio sulfuroxidans TaxID=1773489 RepID=A0A4V2UNB1_9PROT|nr:sulfurtransferase complex subunit TusB [Varunaivibrio sulfuroxidans]TCS60321.1 tRNA 2-thiouridine synthesizing protein B [Varunaivibrio sulfuroxidans]WES30992.1 sulfurtransferase complex subunit TusB [Varunaivibrio sulfuroxidans]